MMVKRICYSNNVFLLFFKEIFGGHEKEFKIVVFFIYFKRRRQPPKKSATFLFVSWSYNGLHNVCYARLPFTLKTPTIILFLFPISYIYLKGKDCFLYVHPISCAIKYIYMRTLCSTSFACECIFHVVINISY